MSTVDSTLAGTRVFFGPYAAPITYTSASQINAVVPYEIAGQSQVVMQVEYFSALSAGTTLVIASAAPGVFTFALPVRGRRLRRIRTAQITGRRISADTGADSNCARGAESRHIPAPLR